MFLSLYIWNLLFGGLLPILQQLHSLWKKRFGEEVDEDLIYVVSVEQVLQIEDFKEVNGCSMSYNSVSFALFYV